MYLVIMLSYDVLNAKPLNWMSWYYLFAVAISKNFGRPRSPGAIISARSSVHVCVWRLANYTIQVGVSVCEFGMSTDYLESDCGFSVIAIKAVMCCIRGAARSTPHRSSGEPRSPLSNGQWVGAFCFATAQSRISY